MSIRLSFIALMASATVVPATAQNAPAATQPLSRATFMQRIDAVFVSADANKDGFADRAELEAAQARELNGRKTALLRRSQEIFKTLDKDNNGTLTVQEFNAQIVAAPIKTDPAAALTRFDTNKDNKVSLSENRAPALAQFDRADTNKDGTLSVAEQKAAANRR
ncbi:MAG TPA: EF-hand domain-containing protein [Sphingomicrobium sp.]|nr:EF-hand domain-containing protein [Sphingomicrobium sp.]